MFSAKGSKAVMLENFNRSKRTGQSAFQAARASSSHSPPSPSSPDSQHLGKNIYSRKYSRLSSGSYSQSLEEEKHEGEASVCSSSSMSSRRHRKGNYSEVRNHEYLKELLTSKDLADTPAGRAIRKLAHAAARYEKSRDQVRISAFETCSMDYANFRILLRRMFFLEFTNAEFKEVCRMFDSNGDKEIDGDEFIVCFTILSNHEKDVARRRDIARRQKDYEKFLEMEKKRQIDKDIVAHGVVDYDFMEEEHDSAMQKITNAAHFYDRTHPSARSTKAFELATMTPLEFRDNLSSIFDVNLTPQELGAAILHYNKGKPGDINCAEFLLDFLRTGYEYRMEVRSKQIEKTRLAEERERKYNEMKTTEQLQRLEERGADMNFTSEDVKSMKEKIRKVAKGYDRTHPAAPSLAGFDSKYLKPGLFRLSFHKTFKIYLTDKELGALTKEFDTAGRGEICNQEFLVHFIRVGYHERCASRSKQLKASRNAIAKEAEENERKIMEDWKIDNENFDPDDYCEEDYHNAVMKIAAEASRYNSEHVSSPDLSLFNGADMSVAEFREMVKRQTRINLSYQEIAALLPEIGSKTTPNMVSTSEFIIKFKAMGWKERQKRRTKQLRKIEEKKRAQRRYQEEQKEKMTANLNEVIDYNFSQSDMDSAAEKMTAAAYKYDKTHPSSMSLNAFQGLSMPHGLFCKMVQHTFNVNLSSKEQGAIVTLYDNNHDGYIDSAEFLSNFFYMQRECRDAVRRRRLEKFREREKVKKEEEARRMARAEEAARAKLAFTQEDEESLMKKLGEVGQKFAIDNASYLEHLKVMKGPAMNCSAFQSTFFRIFLVKLTAAEVGALMHLVNPATAKLRVMDGNKLVNVILRLGRLFEQVLLGKLDPATITYASLKIAEPPVVRSKSPTHGAEHSPLPRLAGPHGASEDRLDSPSREVVVENDHSVSRGCGPEEDQSRLSLSITEAHFKPSDSTSALSIDDSSLFDSSMDNKLFDVPSDPSSIGTAPSPRRLSPLSSSQLRASTSHGGGKQKSGRGGMVSSLLGGHNPWGDVGRRACSTSGLRIRKRDNKVNTSDEVSTLLSPIKGNQSRF